MSWMIDTAHAEVSFSAKHMMITSVRGRFEKFGGEVEFDPANPSATRVKVQIDTASINTSDAKRDGHLKSPDFFDVEKYPTITFQSKSVEVLDESNAKLTGDLTIRDVTHEVTLDVEYLGQAKSPWGTTNAGFSATTKINRKDWGLSWNVALETGGWLVSDTTKINIELELVKQPEPQQVAVSA